MNDNDLLRECATRGYRAVALRLAAALRARDTELAAARTAVEKAAHELDLNAIWFKNHGYPTTAVASSSAADALRSWLASVSPPASGEDRIDDLGNPHMGESL